MLDNVVRLEQSVEAAPSQHASDEDTLNANLQIVKDEKTLQSCSKMLSSPFGLQDLKPNIMDIRSPDGSIVKLANEQDIVKTLGVEMVQNMYKVNVDDINQLFAYHEVFGKLQGEVSPTSNGNNTQQQPNNNEQNNVSVTPKTLLEETEASGSNITEGPPSVMNGSHVCDLCGKMFQYRYQLIVHRRYHTERKPFTCQVS